MLGRFAILSVLCASAPAFAFSNDALASLLDSLWTQSDANADGYLSETEFVTACGKLGLDAKIFTSHQQSLQVFYVALNNDTSNGLSQVELVKGAISYPEYQEPLTAVFLNGAGPPPDLSSALSVPAGAATAEATVTVAMTIAGPPSDIYAGQRAQIKQYLADLAKVPVENVIITFKLSELQAARMRQLQSTKTTKVAATIFVADAAAADAAAATLSTADPAAAPAFAGLEVTETTVASTVIVPPLPITELAIVAGVLVILTLFLCANASYWSGIRARKNREETGDNKKGCCSTGCCSFNAVKPWAFAELVAAIAIAGTVVFLYTEVTGVTDAIINLVSVVLELKTVKLDMIAQFSSMIPASITDVLEQNFEQLKLLPLATMVPGLLAAFFLFVSSLCPLSKARKGSYCCTKCMILFADIFMIVAIIFYSLFAAFSIVFQFVPLVKTMVGEVRTTCVVMPAALSQMVADNEAVITKLTSVGADVSALASTLADASTAVTLVEVACANVNLFIDSLIGLFFEGVLCIVAIVVALYINQTLCCVTGCCFSKPKTEPKLNVTPKAAEKAGNDPIYQNV